MVLTSSAAVSASAGRTADGRGDACDGEHERFGLGHHRAPVARISSLRLAAVHDCLASEFVREPSVVLAEVTPQWAQNGTSYHPEDLRRRGPVRC